jgi:hypothetical protein
MALHFKVTAHISILSKTFKVLNSPFICVSLNSFVTFFVSLPLYVILVHFLSGVVDQCFCCLHWGVSCPHLYYVHCQVVYLL